MFWYPLVLIFFLHYTMRTTIHSRVHLIFNFQFVKCILSDFPTRPVYAELTPVTDFREACCRQWETFIFLSFINYQDGSFSRFITNNMLDGNRTLFSPDRIILMYRLNFNFKQKCQNIHGKSFNQSTRKVPLPIHRKGNI